MDEAKPRTAAINGPLWGTRAVDWAELQEASAVAAFDDVLAACHVGDATAYLDLGCGAGLAARMAADRGALVAGIDAAEPLIDIARRRTADGDFHVGDLEALPFADASFDAITAFNAVQYAGNPVAALAEAKRVARTNAVIAVMVWGEPEGMDAASVIAALKPLLPPPPPGAGGPFALSAPGALAALLASAGLAVERMVETETVVTYPDLATAVRAWNSSGVAARAMTVSGEDAVSDAHEMALAPFRSADGAYRLGARFRTAIARI